MKLGTQLLLAPALTALVALGGGVVNAVLMQREASQNTERFKSEFQSLQAVTGAQEQLGRMHAGVYRTVALIGSLDEPAIKAYREALKAQIAGVKGVTAQLAKSSEGSAATDSELPTRLAAMGSLLDKYGQQADSAVDLASVDPNTGVAAMQGADESFKAASQTMAGIVGRIDSAASASLQASAARARQTTLLLMGLGLLGTVGALALSARMLRRVVRSLGHAAEVTRAVAGGDLAVHIQADRNDELGELQRGLGQMVERLRGSLLTVRRVADSISTAGAEIATGNQDLSERTEHTASNLQQTASSMEELTSTVRQSADSATQASTLARTASTVAQRGGEAVSQVVATMDQINGASRKIADIIGVIDGIAFQTNILALNAAVEAARAGEQGRGFAVVAGEVRSLAGRSAEAAREIKRLIAASVESVESGTRQVRDAGNTMREIVASVQRVSDTIGEISSAASQQSLGLDQVNGAVSQLDRMTQQNAALVEQSAAAALHLKAQAGELTQLVDEFRLDAAAASHPPA